MHLDIQEVQVDTEIQVSSPLLRDRSSSVTYESLPGHMELEEGHLPFLYLFGLNSFACLYGALVSSMGVIILPREMQRMFEEEHALALGMIVGLAGLSQLISPLAGYLTDRSSHKWGKRRPFLVGGGCAAAFFLIGMWYTRTNLMGYAYMVVFLFAMTALNVAYAAFAGLVRDLIPDSQMGTASGVMGVLTMVGAAASIAGLGWWIDIGHCYLIYLGALVVTLTITCLCGQEIPIEDQGPYTWDEVVESYQISLATHGDFFWVFIGRTLYYTAISVQTFIFFYLRDIIHVHDAKTHTAMLCLLAQLSAAMVSFPMGWLSDHFGRKRFIYTACTVISIIYIGYIFSRTFVTVCLMGTLYGVGNGMFIAVDYALACQTLPNPANAARDLGLWGIAAFIGMMLGPVGCGPLLFYFGRTESADHYSLQGYSILMVFGGIVSLCSAAVISLVKKN